jgi:hypothetical protein
LKQERVALLLQNLTHTCALIPRGCDPSQELANNFAIVPPNALLYLRPFITNQQDDISKRGMTKQSGQAGTKKSFVSGLNG